VKSEEKKVVGRKWDSKKKGGGEMGKEKEKENKQSHMERVNFKLFLKNHIEGMQSEKNNKNCNNGILEPCF